MFTTAAVMNATGAGSAGANAPVLPLALLGPRRTARVQAVRGKDEVRRHLACLGIVEDAAVRIVSESGGNMIVEVKGARLALSRQLASRILVCEAGAE